MIGARESKFFHHLSIILTCKNSLFTCKNYCKMVKDVHETGKLCSMCRSACVLQARGDAGDSAQDEVDESGLLALRVLLQFFLRVDRRLPEHR